MDLVDNITTTPDMDSLNMAMSIIRGGSEQPLLDLAVMKVEMDSYLIMMTFYAGGYSARHDLDHHVFWNGAFDHPLPAEEQPGSHLKKQVSSFDNKSSSLGALLTSNLYTSIVVH